MVRGDDLVRAVGGALQELAGAGVDGERAGEGGIWG